MIPLRDTTPTRHFPVVNTTIIAINIVVYFLQLAQGDEINHFIYIYGLVPARYSLPQIADYFTFGQQAFSLLSFMFLHGSFWHILGNMWSLYIFGDNVEDHLGPIRYAVFYLLCGVASGLSHLVLNLRRQRCDRRRNGSLFYFAPSVKNPNPYTDYFYPLFYQYPGLYIFGLMVSVTVYQCRQQPGCWGRHRLVGSYWRFYLRSSFFEAVRCAAGYGYVTPHPKLHHQEKNTSTAGHPSCGFR